MIRTWAMKRTRVFRVNSIWISLFVAISTLLAGISLIVAPNIQAQLPNGYGGERLANNIYMFTPIRSTNGAPLTYALVTLPPCKLSIRLELTTYPTALAFRLMRLNSTSSSAVGTINFQLDSISLLDSSKQDVSKIAGFAFSLYTKNPPNDLLSSTSQWKPMHKEIPSTMIKRSLDKVTFYTLGKVAIFQIRNCIL
jgi:hypothetical protein